MLAYVIGCVLLGSAVAGIAFLVYRRRNGRGRTEHAAATTPLEDQTPQPSSSHGGALNSKSPILQTPAEDISTNSEAEPLRLVQDLDDQTERPFGQTNEACLPIRGEPSESDETRCDESQVSAPQESTGAFFGEKYEHFDIGEAAPEPEDGVGTAHKTGSFGEEPEVHSNPKPEEEPRAVESHDTKAEQSQHMEDHDHEHCNASPVPTPSVLASIPYLPENSAAKIEARGKVTGAALGPAEANQAELGTKVLDTGVTPTIIEEITIEEEKAPKERKPRKYQGLARSAPQPQDNTGQTGYTETGPTTRDRSLPLAVRLRFDPDGFCNVSLIAKRAENSPEEICVDTLSGKMQLGAIHEEWYQHDISGYVSQPCMDLGRKHVVLCTTNLRSQVEQAIQATGAKVAAIVDESLGTPTGWIAFRDVVPTTAVSPLSEADAFNALRPVPHVEISFEEGIRIEYANWLEGHPPLIRVYGDSQHTADVRIDGRPASIGAAGDYRVPGWDSLGSHTVWCAGTNRSYSIVPFTASWERWDAYAFPVFLGSADKTSICGPLVQSTIAGAQSAGISLVVPETNPILIGSVPGDYVIAHRVSDVRATSLIANPPFRPVWALPSDPLHCDKQELRILLINREPSSAEGRRSTLLTNTADERKFDAWVRTILDAGRKGLRTKPDTDSVWSLWLSYKEAARGIWRARR